MNKANHRIYEHLPDTVPVPVRLRNRRAEVFILPLEPKHDAVTKHRGKEHAAVVGSVKPARRPLGEPATPDQCRALSRKAAMTGARYQYPEWAKGSGLTLEQILGV